MMMRSVIRSVDPASEPVSVSEFKTHARIDHSDEDTLITAYLVAARQWSETWLRRSLITQTWVARYDGFPARIVLPYAPLQSVTSIQYVDASGNTQTASTALYVVDTYRHPGEVYLAYDQTWPTTRDEQNAVTITYVAGYGDDPDDVPEAIRHAIKLIAGHLYEMREPVVAGQTVAEVPESFKSLLNLYRLPEAG